MHHERAGGEVSEPMKGPRARVLVVLVLRGFETLLEQRGRVFMSSVQVVHATHLD